MSKAMRIIEVLRQWAKDKEPDNTRVNPQGNILAHSFCHHDRYLWDFCSEFTSAGFKQFDTDQDAHYFGTWVNPQTMEVFSYIEGDVHLVVCEDKEQYNKEIQSMIDYYGEGREFAVVDVKENMFTEYRQNRSSFLLE